MSIPTGSKVRGSTQENTNIVICYCNFPVTSFSGSGNSGIAWVNSTDHSKQFLIDMGISPDSDFNVQMGNIRAFDSFNYTAVVFSDPAQQIQIDLIGVDKLGVDIGIIASWIFTDGNYGCFCNNGEADLTSGLSLPSPTFVCGFRLQFTIIGTWSLDIGKGFPLIFTGFGEILTP